MLTVKPIIVIFMLSVPSLCEPDWGSPEEFLKEVNEFRAKFAKERKIPNMHKLAWSNELAGMVNGGSYTTFSYLTEDFSGIVVSSYRNVTGLMNDEFGKFKNLSEILINSKNIDSYIDLVNTLKTFIGCAPDDSKQYILCLMGFGDSLNFWSADPGEAGSQCPPRFKGENGLCVPVDPSKHTFWGTEEQLLEDVNYMRRKYAKKFGIPNMHQLTWNESLVQVLKSLDLKKPYTGSNYYSYLASNDSSWNGFGKSWRITELVSFSAAVPTIDEDVRKRFVLNQKRICKTMINGKEENTTTEEMIHPLQTSIGCVKTMMKEMKEGFLHERNLLTVCLLGNIGQWPTDMKLDINSKKIPGSECMDGYVDDDGLCVLTPPTPPVQTIPKKPEVSGSPESEREEAESSSTSEFSYGLWILYLFLSFF